MNDHEMVKVLEHLLDENVNITAREVARRHPSLKAVSSITRNKDRSALLSEYQQRQLEYRRAAARMGTVHPSIANEVIASNEIKIQELEKAVQVLVASHVAMLRALGATGGFRKWAEFYENYRDIRHQLAMLGAIPDNITDIHSHRISK
ncbi:hypothetical protein ACIPLR_26875 [Herbaspirillum huttiense]|uniref:hypothetical protein n=1 Tax=Herbaspirillum huttiense TaxID=863372 RepID=UPI00381CF619